MSTIKDIIPSSNIPIIIPKFFGHILVGDLFLIQLMEMEQSSIYLSTPLQSTQQTTTILFISYLTIKVVQSVRVVGKLFSSFNRLRKRKGREIYSQNVR